MKDTSIVTTEIVLNTELVQYRISKDRIHAMLLGGHKFTISPSQLSKIQIAFSLFQESKEIK